MIALIFFLKKILLSFSILKNFSALRLFFTEIDVLNFLLNVKSLI